MAMVRHLLGMAGATKEQLNALLESADSLVEVSNRDLKKVPALRGKTVINLFLESSTRTRASFEIAGKRLSADTINISGGESSVSKGETLLDTARNLEAMNPDVIVLRHKESGAAHFLAQHLKATSIVNAGDGMNEHPTQALLDCLTLHREFKKRGTQGSRKTIAILGDVRHSRVARSNVYAHLLLGNNVRLVGPKTLVPEEFSHPTCFGAGVSIHHDLRSGIEGADVVMCLRMQLERQTQHFVPSLDEYTRRYCLTENMLRRHAPEAIVMHPGPVNRGVEIASDVVDGPRSVVTAQVHHGVAVRMAVLLSVTVGIAPPAEIHPEENRQSV